MWSHIGSGVMSLPVAAMVHLGLCVCLQCTHYSNSAIASYLKSQGYTETLECFEREADVVRTVIGSP